MATAIIIPPGARWGQLTAVARASNDKHRAQQWLFRCDCGRSKVIRIHSVIQGRAERCGQGECRRNGRQPIKERIGKQAEYRIWRGMLRRCLNSTDIGFKYYGGRGIAVCDRWATSFDAFYADMGARPSPSHSIERRNNDGAYSPGNCKWGTPVEQARNSRNTRFVIYQGRRMSTVEAAELAGIKVNTVRARQHKGWSDEAALTTAVRPRTARPNR